MKCLNRLVDEIASDEMNGGLRSEFPDVPEVILVGACQVGVDGGWAHYASFNSDHLGFRFF